MRSPYDETHDCGNLYFHTMRVPRTVPVLQRDGTTHEVDEPWRVGRCWVLRFFAFALAVGWWGPPRTRAQMLDDEAREAEAVADAEEIAYEASVGVQQIREDFREQEPRTSSESPYDVRTWS